MANLPAKRSPLVAPQGVLDLFTGEDLPIESAQTISDADLEAAIVYVARTEAEARALRWLAGAALTARKNDTPRGSWDAVLNAWSNATGVTPRTLRTYMAEAQAHYGLALPKGARPEQRGKTRPPKEISEAPSNISDDVPVDPIDTEPAPPIADEPPFVAAPKAKERPVVAVKKATEADGFRAAGRHLLDGNPVALDLWAKEDPGMVGALETLIGRLSLIARGARTKGQPAPARSRPARTTAAPKVKAPAGTIRCGHRFGPPCDDCVKAAG